MSTVAENTFCAEQSLALGEQLFGTAPRADVWLALEVTQAWGFDAFREAEISEAVKAHINAALKVLPKARLQLIRQIRRTQFTSAFFVVTRNAVYRFELARYEDLLSLNVPEIVSGAASYAGFRTNEPLFLICTNGKRDACCARIGLAAYQAAAEFPGVWQTTHLGGHRFAATAVALPTGTVYGRLRPEMVPMVLKDQRAGQIHLDYYRGCSYYEEPVQAAEYFLRSQLDERRITALSPTQVEQIAETRWRVAFASGDHSPHQVSVEQFQSAFDVSRSCVDIPGKSAPVPQFRRLE